MEYKKIYKVVYEYKVDKYNENRDKRIILSIEDINFYDLEIDIRKKIHKGGYHSEIMNSTISTFIIMRYIDIDFDYYYDSDNQFKTMIITFLRNKIINEI